MRTRYSNERTAEPETRMTPRQLIAVFGEDSAQIILEWCALNETPRFMVGLRKYILVLEYEIEESIIYLGAS